MDRPEKFSKEKVAEYIRIYGGLAMPSEKNPGFAVIVGETYEKGYQGKTKYVVIDEVEDPDARSLVRHAGWLDFRYSPKQWYGDTMDVALDKFVRELNKEITGAGVEELKRPDSRRLFRVTYSGLLLSREQDRPFAYIVPELNRLLGGVDRNKDRQRLFLKSGSSLMGYMKTPESGDAASLRFGDYPSIDALAFCVFGMIEIERDRNRAPLPDVMEMDYDTIS